MIIHSGRKINNNHRSIILEYADGGNLLEYIQFLKETFTMISEREALMIFFQLLKGLHALHKKKIMHRDLKVKFIYFYHLVGKHILNSGQESKNWRFEHG
jgi:serine/threonine protein kinase